MRANDRQKYATSSCRTDRHHRSGLTRCLSVINAKHHQRAKANNYTDIAAYWPYNREPEHAATTKRTPITSAKRFSYIRPLDTGCLESWRPQLTSRCYFPHNFPGSVEWHCGETVVQHNTDSRYTHYNCI